MTNKKKLVILLALVMVFAICLTSCDVNGGFKALTDVLRDGAIFEPKAWNYIIDAFRGILG